VAALAHGYSSAETGCQESPFKSRASYFSFQQRIEFNGVYLV
jgi:hypothetical protein